MLSDDQIKQILVSENLVGKEEVDNLADQAKHLGSTLLDFLETKKKITQESFYKSVANFYHLEYTELKDSNVRKDVLFLIPESIASSHKIIAFDKNEKTIKIAALNPQDLEIFEFLSKKTNLEIEVYITSPNAVAKVLKAYHKGLNAEFVDIENKKKTDEKKSENDGKDLKELAQDLPVIRIVDTLLEYAIYEGASDIHIEPGEKELNVRYRIDGILKNVMTLPKAAHAGIAARIKILSNLKLDEHRLPQDGRFKISTDDYKVAFRVSIIPTFDGEKIVMRLLNEKQQLLTLEMLGFQDKVLDIIKRNIEKPHGMILVTGPTGSGKTTTLYTILNILNKPEVNISTIEDPIEYRMQRVNQSQVNPKIGFTFASGLRAFLRQDPDIIMVGEIRDGETAEIAVHAAMTGHLVLSTLHTNDAVTTLPRIGDMGVPSFLIATTTNIIIAQRLVRKICQKCIYSYTLDEKGVSELKKSLDLETLFFDLEKEGAIAKDKQKAESLLFYRGKGCKDCNNNGYKGRIGIYEVLEISEKISGLILKKTTSDELTKAALEQGMMTMLVDGFLKAKNGITTIEEIMRVTKE